KDYFLSSGDSELARIDGSKKFRRLYAEYEERLARTGNVDFGDLIKKPVEILRGESEVARRFHDRFKVIMVDEYQDANVAQFEFLKELAGPETYICVVGDDDQSIYRFRGAEVKNILEFPDRFPGTEIIRLERNYRSIAPILKAASSVVDHNQGRLGKTLRAERGGGKLPVLAFLPDQDQEAVFCVRLIENSMKNLGASPEVSSLDRKFIVQARAIPRSEDRFHNFFDGSKFNRGKPRGMDPRLPIKGGALSDWAILYRTNAQSLGFETELLRRGIPYRVVGSLKFYEREEIKDALALLSFLINPRDEIAFRRVVNKPARGVGPVTVDKIIEGGTSADLAEAVRALAPELSPKAKSGVEFFLKVIEEGRALLDADSFSSDVFASDDAAAADRAEGPGAKTPPAKKQDTAAAKTAVKAGRKRTPKNREDLVSGEGLSACVVHLLRNSGIAEYHQTQDEVSGNQRLNNLQELANAASLYAPTRGGLLEFLEHIELDRSLEDQSKTPGERDDAVTLITFHNTKGLEFRKVIMTGLEQGVFPREDKKNEELEEERRLFYVGATRAMNELYLTSCAVRRMFGRTLPVEPSLFLGEIDKSSLRIIGETPYGFGASGAAARKDAFSERGGVYGGGSFRRSAHNAPENAPDDGAASWRRGDRLFHDDYGYGAVMEVRDSEEGPVVRVCFETGKELRFLGGQQGHRFTKIGRDV
ncbi:MAG: ATP-dependent helicase, partial [Treponema sp.]|nr:ATP-dependent helicase [Treponema sp.]